MPQRDHAQLDAIDFEPLLPEARSRLRQWTTVVALLGTAITAWAMMTLDRTTADGSIPAIVILCCGLSPIAIVGYWILVRRHLHTFSQFQRATFLAVVTVGGPILVAGALSIKLAQPDPTGAVAVPLNGLTLFVPYLLLLYLLSAAMLPWPPTVSIRGPLALLVIWSVCVASTTQLGWDTMGRFVTIIGGFCLLMPGLGLSAWRWRRKLEGLHHRQLQHHVDRLGGELVRAREVHEGLFPPTFDTGPVHFQYVYVPNEQIGGDFVHVWRCPKTGRTSVVLMDVVGHGLTAALTVNRLSGELERLRAEYPECRPGELLCHLNRYIYLTMSRFNLYTTAGCFEIDPVESVLRWALAGHPPAMLRRTTGEVEELECTTVLMGALPADQFDAAERQLDLTPGDILITYTDGTIESRTPDGEEFTLERMRACVGFDTPPRDWTKFILNAVERHHMGHQSDDILVVSMIYDHPHLPQLNAEFDPLETSIIFQGPTLT